VCRVIVNQAHCFATGGSYDNALPFSLSMGCGTWGGNGFSDNLNYRHFLNITRVVRPLDASQVREPTDEELFGAYRRRHGA
jgi:sulfoacetaldehyde dehydrogenase